METCPYTACMPRKSKKPVGQRPAQGRHLTALRKAAALTQTELATIIGVPQANIAFWERSDKPPRSDVLQPLAEALGVTVEVLLHPETHQSSPRGRQPRPKGQVAALFEAVSKLPRRQQRRIVDVLQALLAQSGDGHRAA